MHKQSPASALHQQVLMDYFDQLHTQQQFRCLTDPDLEIGSTKSEVALGDATNYLFGGAFKSKASGSVAFTADDHDIEANEDDVQEACYLVSFNSGGNLVLTMGAVATGAGAAAMPDVPANHTPIGAVRVAVDAGSTPFDAGSDDLDDAHLTVTFMNIGWMAPRFDAAQ